MSTGELSRLGSKCDRGDASCLIVIHDGESVHLTETWGCGELSRCKNYEEMVTVHAHSRLTRLSGDILWSGSHSCCQGVTFELNVWLNLSWKATTKSLGSLGAELMLQVLGESTRAMTIRVIHGDEGMGDIPGVRGGSGEPVGSAQ